MHLALRHLCKSHAGIPALRDVSLDLHGGEVHALMGENGAGKSTLIRVLAGLGPADAGEATLDGHPLRLASPADAARAGFRFVHQELALAPALAVAETVALGRPLPRRWGVALDWPRLRADAAAALARFGVTHIDPGERVGRLGLGDRMLVRLASLLASGEAWLFVLDEPTAALSAPESERLFAVLRELRAQGAAILYVSHRLDEVMALADRVTVLRDGRHVLSTPRRATNRESLIRAMTGRDLADARPTPPAPGPPLLRLRGVTAGPLRDLSLDLQAGEVLGLAGLDRAGQSEVLRLLLGDLPVTAGEATLAGQPLPRSVPEGWRRGIALVPRERRAEALMLGRSVTANTVLPHLARLHPWGLARARPEAREAHRMAEALGLRRRALSQPVRELSGGNQQKVAFARAILRDPRLLLLDEPSRGVDLGARADLHAAIRAAAARGAGVVVASTDLPELLALSHRILVLRGGRPHVTLDARGLDPATLLAAIQSAPPRAAA